jgi:hypothetical protein
VKRRNKKAYTVRHIGRLGTAWMRTLPDYLVIGAQKCGTSFLHRLLARHPRIKPSFLKEVHYFDLNFGYLSRGIYVDQLLAWSEFFDRSRMLVLRSEDLFGATEDTLETILDFLGVPRWAPKTPTPIPNKREYTGLSPTTRQRLDEYFRPHNRRLYEYLGVDLGW